MNRIDRLFAILLHLQRRRRVRAAELARAFEVSERTIYRDMLALNECGIPIISLPGTGYELSEGYFLPPLCFTFDEAQALSLSARLFTSLVKGQLAADAAGALAKLAVALPKHLRDAVDARASIMQFLIPPVQVDLDDPRLSLLQTAIQEQRIVRLAYYSYNRQEHTEREIEPRILSYYNGVWYVTGYCRLRRTDRDFRVDRIDTLELRLEIFTPRPPAAHPSNSPITVKLRFRPEVVRWVRERQHYAFQSDEVDPDGKHIMTYQVTALSELHAWLLSWGAAVEPLAPPELRNAIRQEAQHLLNLLT